jgi:hypothetical protein
MTLFGYQKIYIERYLIIGLPFFAIVLARGATEFSNRYMTGIGIAAVVTLGTISYAMFLSKNDAWTVYKPKPDMRGAAKYLAAQDISADDATILYNYEYPEDLLFYIDRFAPQKHAIVQTDYDVAKVDQAITAGKWKAIYAVKYRWEPADYGFLEENQRLVLTDTRSFKDVVVNTFIPK